MNAKVRDGYFWNPTITRNQRLCGDFVKVRLNCCGSAAQFAVRSEFEAIKISNPPRAGFGSYEYLNVRYS